MKTIIGALTLILTAPVAAQAAPAADPHAQHQGMDHSQHQKSHEGHDKGCCDKGCCEKMKQQGKAMDCCKKGDAKSGDAPAAGDDGHANHDH